MQEENKTTNLLESHHTSLTREKKEVLWNAIEADIKAEPIPSPFLFSFITKKHMTQIALALVLLLGTGGTVAASESARPGDLLFPIDQAVEDVRLALAVSDETKAELRLKFAEERIQELRSLLSETSSDDNESSDGNSDSNSTSTSTSTTTSTTIQLEAEADVFTDTTIVKVEINDRKTTFETDADTRDEVVDEIVDRFDVDRATVERVLDFEIEDRASRVGERVNQPTDERINASLKLLEELLDELSDNDRDRIENDIFTEFSTDSRIDIDDDRIRIDSDDDRVEIRNDDGDQRIEIRDGDNRIRIREKDGETRIDIDGDASGFDLSDFLNIDNDSDDSDDSSDDRDDNSSSFEAEADVFTDTTIVKVEINDRKTTFETDADTRDEVVDEIVDRFDVDRATVERVLDFEIEDRASRPKDSDDNDSDNNSDDSSDNNLSSDDGNDTSDDSDGRVRIEVEVEDGIADVRLEYNGEKDEFETPYSSRSALIVQLANRSGLSESVISSNLDLEIKD